MFCTKCGARLNDDANFCEKCGNRVGDTQTQSGFDPEPCEYISQTNSAAKPLSREKFISKGSKSLKSRAAAIDIFSVILIELLLVVLILSVTYMMNFANFDYSDSTIRKLALKFFIEWITLTITTLISSASAVLGMIKKQLGYFFTPAFVMVITILVHLFEISSKEKISGEDTIILTITITTTVISLLLIFLSGSIDHDYKKYLWLHYRQNKK